MAGWSAKRRAVCGTLIALAVVLVHVSVCRAITAEAVDGIVKPLMDKAKIPGLSVSISTGDGNVIERAYGFANLEHQAPTTPDSIFEIGSLTKTFTALGILLLQEEGRLSVEDKVSKYFPDFARGDEITLKHLLQHTSGIKEILTVEPFCSNQAKDWQPGEVVKMLQSLPLDFNPGEKAQYSNSGCMLLGVVIEKTSGTSYGDFISERIIKPLGMTHTRLGGNSELAPKRVAGYKPDASTGTVQNAAYASLVGPYASGGILSTPSDLVKLKKVFHPGALLKQASIDAMFAPARLNNGQEYSAPETGMTFGYCLEILKFGGLPVPGKTGGISGFNAYFAYLPEKDLMIAATANADNSLGVLLQICLAIFQL
ncbi:MAG: serine hydrolase domain-containing protein [Syntrophobacteraceae bacterium]